MTALCSPANDQSPVDCGQALLPSLPTRVKGEIGQLLYPLKNRIQRGQVRAELARIGVPVERLAPVDGICWGNKGFGHDLFLSQLARRLRQVETVLCFGCGLGQEAFSIARFLRPRKIIGYEYFNYRRAWDWVAGRIQTRYGTEVVFKQVDLREPTPSKSSGQADLLRSFRVLEHFGEMESTFANLRPLLRRGGYFASLWGPMWYSYGGDHIAPELGWDKGFEHVRLPHEEYLHFYKTHPRNREDVRRGIPTWLELGLHNFARYEDYMRAIAAHFGRPQFLKWQVSPEAFRWHDAYPEDWQRMLRANPHLEPLDLALNGAAVLTRAVGSS